MFIYKYVFYMSEISIPSGTVQYFGFDTEQNLCVWVQRNPDDVGIMTLGLLMTGQEYPPEVTPIVGMTLINNATGMVFHLAHFEKSRKP